MYTVFMVVSLREKPGQNPRQTSGQKPAQKSGQTSGWFIGPFKGL